MAFLANIDCSTVAVAACVLRFSLLADDRYDELRGMGKLCELMLDSLIKRFEEFFPNDYA